MNIRWNRVLIAILVILTMAHWRAIRNILAELPAQQFWSDFCQTCQDMPPGAKYVVVLAILALAYVTVWSVIMRRSSSSRNKPTGNNP